MKKSPLTTDLPDAPSARSLATEPRPPRAGGLVAAAAALALAISGAFAALFVFVPTASAAERPNEATSSAETGERAGDPGARAPSAGDGEALARLAAFTDDLESFRASFEQTLYDADSEPVQSARGTVVLKRPGRFVWDYAGGADGEGQLIVADGERVWLYDRELAQVTVDDLDERVAGTPFALLSGEGALADGYAITPLGKSGGIEWLELLPKTSGGDFEALFVGLDETGLAVLELRDAFGQATQIRFGDFEADVELDDATFEFEVPEGVDVIGLER